MVNVKWRGLVVANFNGSLWQSGVHSRIQLLALECCEKRHGE